MQRRFPIAGIIAVVLIVLFEVLVWQNRYRLWDANYILLEQKRLVMTEESPADDIAILGSSRLYHVRPDMISRAMGGARVVNYAWGYCGVEAYEGMLRGLINAGRSPKAVLVDGAPEIFAYRPEILTITGDEGLRIGFTVTVPRMAALQTELGQLELSTAWDIFEHHITPPSTLNREQLVKAVESTYSTGNLPTLPPQYDRLVTTWKQQGWFYFVEPGQVVQPGEFQMLEKNTGPYVLRDNSDITAKYESFLELARKHDVQVVMVPVPNNEYVFDKFQRSGIYDKYNAWLSGLESRYDNFHAPDPRWFYWPGALGDALHVNESGAEQHMKLIVNLVKETLGPPTAGD